jgi:uncharacterized OB-fold protein
MDITTTDHAGPDQAFRAYLAAGEFRIQRSASSGRYVFYPRVAEPLTGLRDLEWVKTSGDGVVHATTCNRQRPEQGGDYNVALIDLAEGPRMMGRVVGIDPQDVRIGMPVRAEIGLIDDATVILWRVVAPAEKTT